MFTRQQTLLTLNCPSSKPSTPHTIHIISAILPPRRHLQNNPPHGQKQRIRNKHQHYRSLHNPRQILNPCHQTRPPLHLQSHLLKRYFTDVYLYCLHKDPKDTTKLHPLGIPTAIRHLITSHVARTLRDKFSSHLLPFNYAVGVPNGSDFVVKAMQLSKKKLSATPNVPTNPPHAQPSSST